MQPSTYHRTPDAGTWGLPAGLLALVVVAGAAGLFATYWDDAWHTDLGRDQATIPPHLLLYASMATIGAVVATWGLSALWRSRSLAAVWRQPPLQLAAAGGTVTLAAAPVDAAWHASFGRDAVLWSPPHMLAIFGSLALLVGFLAGARPGTSPWILTGLGALLLGTATVPVLEFETDVPQFSETLYLPVLLAAALLAAWVLGQVIPGPLPVARAVGLYVLLLLVAGAVAVALPPPPAQAHDPGQGRPIAPVALTGTSDGHGAITITADSANDCAALPPRRLLARRAGQTITGTLTATGHCRYAGQVRVPATGRWFVHVELQPRGFEVEAWLPVDASSANRQVAHRQLYLPAGSANAAGLPGGEVAAGIALYALGALLLALIIGQAHGPARTPPVLHSAGTGGAAPTAMAWTMGRRQDSRDHDHVPAGGLQRRGAGHRHHPVGHRDPPTRGP